MFQLQNASPEIKREQEWHPPTRLDDPAEVAAEERKFGLAIPVMIAIITVLFLAVIGLFAL